MKVYYIFQIKKEIKNLYEDTPSVLFHILKTIYYLEKSEVEYGYNLFRQIIVPIPKQKIDKDIYIKFHQTMPYSKKKQIHYINNLYRNEVSRLLVGNTFIKLEAEQNFSTFFPILQEELENCFVCSFQKTDFFFLEKLA